MARNEYVRTASALLDDTLPRRVTPFDPHVATLDGRDYFFTSTHLCGTILIADDCIVLPYLRKRTDEAEGLSVEGVNHYLVRGRHGVIQVAMSKTTGNKERETFAALCLLGRETLLPIVLAKDQSFVNERVAAMYEAESLSHRYSVVLNNEHLALARLQARKRNALPVTFGMRTHDSFSHWVFGTDKNGDLVAVLGGLMPSTVNKAEELLSRSFPTPPELRGALGG